MRIAVVNAAIEIGYEVLGNPMSLIRFLLLAGWFFPSYTRTDLEFRTKNG
jgi:hypothetical protein